MRRPAKLSAPGEKPIHGKHPWRWLFSSSARITKLPDARLLRFSVGKLGQARKSEGDTPSAFALRATPDGQLICPTGKSPIFLSSPPAKNISLAPSGKSSPLISTVLPHKGAYRDRHERGAGCGGRGSAWARDVIAGRVSRERSTARWTNGDCGVRQSRVVLAPVAGVKSAEAKSARPGADKP
jgi:hypothetical protein